MTAAEALSVQAGRANPDVPLLEIRHANKVYANGTVALHDANLTVEQGEFLAVVGASGCGKSTMLRMIAGLGEATDGEILVDGMPPKRARRSGNEMAFVFQEPTLLPWRNVMMNVQLPLELAGAQRHRREEAAERALELVGLAPFANRYPRELSGGMKMRVSLARAFAMRPRLMLMDEPFGALDEITRQKLNEDLLQIWRETGTTVMFVTHSVFEATFLSTRVVVMSPRPGRIVADLRNDLDQPRTGELRTTVPFVEMAGTVSDQLRSVGGDA